MRLIRSEILKLRTTRTTLGLVLGMVALVGFVVVIQLIASRLDDPGTPRIEDADTQRTIFATASVAALFSVLVGVLAVTSEFRHGTIRPTLLFAPARELLVSAKSVACSLAGGVLGMVSVALAFTVTLAWLRVDGIERVVTNRELVAIAAGTVGATVLWAAIGVGVGAVVRNQVGAVVGTIVWSLIPEPLLQGLVPRIGKFTPGAASDALSGGTGADILSPLAGLLVLGLWALVLVAVGAALTGRRDVP
jgi:ABC-2 type transport system permease protein